jgi:hypothetical protein
MVRATANVIASLRPIGQSLPNPSTDTIKTCGKRDHFFSTSYENSRSGGPRRQGSGFLGCASAISALCECLALA